MLTNLFDSCLNIHDVRSYIKIKLSCRKIVIRIQQKRRKGRGEARGMRSLSVWIFFKIQKCIPWFWPCFFFIFIYLFFFIFTLNKMTDKFVSGLVIQRRTHQFSSGLSYFVSLTFYWAFFSVIFLVILWQEQTDIFMFI